MQAIKTFFFLSMKMLEWIWTRDFVVILIIHGSWIALAGDCFILLEG